MDRRISEIRQNPIDQSGALSNKRASDIAVKFKASNMDKVDRSKLFKGRGQAS